jgi:large subunit ribosomal protein L3
VRTSGRDRYDAVQIGFGTRKEKNIKKPQKGHMKGLGNFMKLREFRIDRLKPKDSKPELVEGDKISAATFSEGDKVKITGISKGKGFQGVVRRHGFHGHNTTHGTKDQVRMGGSVGATAPAHVFKGLRMPGHMGNDQVTVHNLEIIKVDKEAGVLYIKGAVPGARDGLLLVSGKGELITTVEEVAEEVEEKAGKIAEEAGEEVGEVAEGVDEAEPEGAKEVKEEIAIAESEPKEDVKADEAKTEDAAPNALKKTEEKAE